MLLVRFDLTEMAMLKHFSRCLFCEQPLYLVSHQICTICYQQLPILQQSCLRCGLPKSDPQQIICNECHYSPPQWHYLTAVTDYVEPLKSLLHQFKFMQCFELAHALARLMLLCWLANYRHYHLPKPDLITCVPLHHSRFCQRGFNQSALLAKPLARWLNRPFVPTLLSRSRSRYDQKQLTAEERRLNLHNRFHCRQQLQQQQIAVIDDIVTTGSTANEIARQLYACGAASVQIISVCRTL